MLKIKTLRPLILIAAAAAVSLFTACLNDDGGSKTLTAVIKGPLSALDSTPLDTNISTREWQLPVDTADARELRGDCIYTAWLADSASVELDSSSAWYTNTQMGSRTVKATLLRLDGIRLSLDPGEPNQSFYTHYRVEFECEY